MILELLQVVRPEHLLSIICFLLVLLAVTVGMVHGCVHHLARPFVVPQERLSLLHPDVRLRLAVVQVVDGGVVSVAAGTLLFL